MAGVAEASKYFLTKQSLQLMHLVLVGKNLLEKMYTTNTLTYQDSFKYRNERIEHNMK